MKQRNMLFIAVLLPLVLTLTYCSGKQPAPGVSQPRKEMANAKAEEQESADYGPEDKAPSAESRSLAGQLGTKDEDQKTGEIPFIFLSSNKYEGERLLEYQVNLTYETKDFVVSRKDFLDIVSKYGYLSYVNSGYGDLRYSMSAQFNIKVADIYRVVKELDKLGSLRYENTSVVDHTRDMAWNERKARRLQIRDQRISRVLAQVAGENKNWKDREDALERSEDALDQAEQGKWDITDQVTWAKISLTVSTPQDAAPVSIPTFQNALVLLVNGFFKVLYVLVVISPFIAIGAVVWFKRKKIVALFTRKKAS
jgi:hypothetical protein